MSDSSEMFDGNEKDIPSEENVQGGGDNSESPTEHTYRDDPESGREAEVTNSSGGISDTITGTEDDAKGNYTFTGKKGFPESSEKDEKSDIC